MKPESKSRYRATQYSESTAGEIWAIVAALKQPIDGGVLGRMKGPKRAPLYVTTPST